MDAGMTDVPVVVGGIIPEADADSLRANGVAAVFTPKDYDATAIMLDVVQAVRKAHNLAPVG
jgi:(2R)-ethylmalonyl-CoA mutase